MPFIPSAFTPAARAHTDTHACTYENTPTRIRFLTDARSFCVSHTHTHTHTHAHTHSRAHRWIPRRPGGGSGWDRDEHMLGSEQQCVIHISPSISFFLSFNLSLPSSSYRRHPFSHLSQFCLPPCAFEKLSVSHVFCTQTHQRTVPGPIEAIRYVWLKSGDFSLWFKEACVFSAQTQHSCLSSAPFFMQLAGYQTPHYSNLASMPLP